VPPGPPLIELRGLLLRSQRELPAARRIDLIVWPGELVLLAGQPRSGRSELLNVLGLLDRPAAGSYLLNGTDTARLKDRDRSAVRGRQIGIVFQRKMLLPTRSVLDNVILPLRYLGVRRRDRVTAALAALDRVGIASTAGLMAWQLSAEELALCAIARSLVTKPGLLLCDDPTAGVDEETTTRVIALLASLHREGKTVLIASAEQLAAAYSSRSIELARPTVSLTGGVIGLPTAATMALADTEAERRP
jgi:putative ABC transport system ATP-binding protein